MNGHDRNQAVKIAIVKDFLPVMRGAEKVLEAWCEVWPDAHIYALFHNQGALSPTIERMRIRTSFLQRMPGVRKRYPFYLPLMPAAIESLNLDGYDVVLSMSQCVAKGARTDGLHLCYCLTPMRYVWDMRRNRRPVAGIQRRDHCTGREGRITLDDDAGAGYPERTLIRT